MNATKASKADKRKSLLIPGARRDYLGEVYLIQDYLAVTINHNDTTKLPHNLLSLLEEVSLIGGDLKLTNKTVTYSLPQMFLFS